MTSRTFTLSTALACLGLVAGTVGCGSDDPADSSIAPAADAADPSRDPEQPGGSSKGNKEKGPAADKAPSPHGDEPSAQEGQDEDAPSDDADKDDDHRKVTVAKRSGDDERARSKSKATDHDANDAGEVSPGDGEIAPLSVKRLVVSRDVADREPTDNISSIDLDDAGQIVAFVEVLNPEKQASKVRVRFSPPAGSPYSVGLDIGALPRYRTWAITKKAKVVGAWSVSVVDEAGAELARTEFEVTP